jgi:hypothetical protein
MRAPKVSITGANAAPMKVETEKINTICVCAKAWHTDSKDTFRIARFTIMGPDNQRIPPKLQVMFVNSRIVLVWYPVKGVLCTLASQGLDEDRVNLDVAAPL